MLEEENENDSADFQLRSSNFLKWFKSNPGTRLSMKITLADLRSRNAGRGVLATTDISAEEELFAVPQSLVLHKSNSELYSIIPDSFADLGPWDALIIVLIYEYLRQDTSPWFPYLQLLPTTFDTLMFWTPEELSELRGSAVVDKIGKQSAEEIWNSTILPIMLDDGELFPVSTTNRKDRERQLLELAHIAGSMIMAYAFDIGEDDDVKVDEDISNSGDSDLTDDDEDNPVKGMVPYADMLNADAHRNNACLSHEDGFLIMRATKTIKAGDEVFNDYGPLPRSDLLRMYGYITDNYSIFDVVEISAGLLESAAVTSGMNPSYLAKKREELENLGLMDDAFVIARPKPGSKLQDLISEELRTLITAFCRPIEKFDPLKLSKDVKESGLTLSEASLLLISITNRLGEYDLSLQADSDIVRRLQDQPDFQLPERVSRKRFKMAVQVRKAEKEILHQYLQLIQTFLAQQTLQGVEDSAKRKRHENDTAAVNKKRSMQSRVDSTFASGTTQATESSMS